MLYVHGEEKKNKNIMYNHHHGSKENEMKGLFNQSIFTIV